MVVSWLLWLLEPCSREAEQQAKVLPGRLQMKRPRPQQSTPGGSKIEPRGGQNGILEASGDLLGGSWAPDGRQDRSGSAPGRLLGRSWRLLGRSWRLFGPSWPCQEVPGRPREAPGKGSGRPFRCFFGMVQRQKLKKRTTTYDFNDFGKLFGQGFALMFALFFGLPGTRPAKQQTSTIIRNYLFLWVARHSHVFHRHRKGQ